MMDTPQIGDIWKNNWSSNTTHNSGETHYLLLNKVEPDNSKDTKWVAFSYKRHREVLIYIEDYSNEIVTNKFTKVS